MAVSGCTDSNKSSPSSESSLTNVQITPDNNRNNDDWGYELTATLIPEGSYEYMYLSADVYDENGTIISNDPVIWNVNHPRKGETYPITGSILVHSATKPSKIVLHLYDDFAQKGSDPILNQTVDL